MSMDVLKLCFILLLPLTACFEGWAEETLVKTVGQKPDVTRICANETQNITLIICQIRTQRSREKECNLTYYYGKDFFHGCGSRFTVIKENQTAFLHLTSLTPEDSGNYTCQCSSPDGTYFFHISITVEGRRHLMTTTVYFALIGVTVFIIITLVVLGFIHRRLKQGKQPESLSCPPNMGSEDIEPYSTFIRRESGLYSTVKLLPLGVATADHLPQSHPLPSMFFCHTHPLHVLLHNIHEASLCKLQRSSKSKIPDKYNTYQNQLTEKWTDILLMSTHTVYVSTCFNPF